MARLFPAVTRSACELNPLLFTIKCCSSDLPNPTQPSPTQPGPDLSLPLPALYIRLPSLPPRPPRHFFTYTPLIVQLYTHRYAQMETSKGRRHMYSSHTRLHCEVGGFFCNVLHSWLLVKHCLTQFIQIKCQRLINVEGGGRGGRSRD